MPHCRPRRRKFWKFDYELKYEMVHSEVYLNKYAVSIAPFSTPAFTSTPIQKTALFCMFSLFNFSSIFQGVSWPHLPLCADAHMAWPLPTWWAGSAYAPTIFKRARFSHRMLLRFHNERDCFVVHHHHHFIIIYSLKIGAGQQGRISGTYNCPQYNIKCRNMYKNTREFPLQETHSRSQHRNSANTSSVVIAE